MAQGNRGSEERELLAPQWFVGFDSLMQIIDSIIAFGISYYALKGYRLVREKTLFFLHFSFVLLGVGLLIDGIITVPALAFRGLSPVTSLSYLIRIIGEIVAYALLLFAYLKQTRSFMLGTTLTSMILDYNPFLETIVFFLVAYVASQAAMNYTVKKERNSLLVFIGFLLLAMSHMFFILPPIFRLFFVIAHVTQLLGFAALLTMLVRVTRTR